MRHEEREIDFKIKNENHKAKFGISAGGLGWVSGAGQLWLWIARAVLGGQDPKASPGCSSPNLVLSKSKHNNTISSIIFYEGICAFL